jgi:uncharacterized protein (DUF2147 family)
LPLLFRTELQHTAERRTLGYPEPHPGLVRIERQQINHKEHAMTTFITRIVQAAAFAATIAAATAASASGEPTGVWIDHTGRGAVEITNCGGSLCGRVVWLKDTAHNETCGKQVIGNVKPVGGGKWDNGWIYDVDEDRRYDVEITPMGDRLKVMGYMGNKFLSETMTWRRAPADLKRCDA